MLRNEPPAVLERLAALEAKGDRAASAIPTLIPGSADCAAMVAPPERIGAFRLTSRIGRGGMGDVWEALRDDGLYEQRVAIKLIQRHALRFAASAFADERRFLARLEHPNIARLIDGGVTDDGLPWLAMEFIDGAAIDVSCAGEADSERVALMIKAADAVQFAHSRMIAHGDLKPSNILVGASGRVKLLDFGVASMIGDEPHGRVGSGPLTREFASPQRLAGGGPSVADDVFALGRTLALVLAGSRDAELAAVVRKASEPDEGDRYGSVAQFVADLERWQARLPVTAMPNGWRYRAGKFVERHRRGVLATGIAMVALGATTGVATSNFLRAERERGEAAARFEDARGSAHYVSFELLDRLAAQPGTLALRADAARVAQRYLDRLAASAAATPASRIEAARGLLRLAAAQQKPGRPNLGNTAEARANLARAAALAGQLAGAEAADLAIWIRLDQARMASFIDNDMRAARGFLADAQRRMDKASPDPVRLGQYWLELSAVRQWDGDFRGGIAAADRALAVLPQDGDAESLLRRATAWDLLAEATYFLPDPVKAATLYRRALALNEQAVRATPGNQIAARQLARAQWALGSTLLNTGGDAEALQLLTRSVAILHAIAATDPADRDVQRTLRISQAARAQALAANGRPGEALTILRAELDERARLWRARPDETIRLRDYASMMKAVADLEVRSGQLASGCARYADVLRIVREMQASGRLTGLDARETLGETELLRAKRCARS